jgi:ubiquinone/menaquinone biosynthesis C-methylase UbiE
MSDYNEKMTKYYEQVGVAMTCRSFEEYEKMFVLNLKELQQGAVLDIAAGASSFTAGARASGIKARAVDPLYRLTLEQMAEHGLNEIEVSTAKLAKLADQYNWAYYGNLERHRDNRLMSLDLFLQDYADKEASQVYIPCALPQLPFKDNTFSLVLCSHFLFLYQEQFDYTFHLNAVKEMLRVCRSRGEIRIYPVYDLKGQPYAFLEQLLAELNGSCDVSELIKSELPFLPGSTHFLSIVKP